MKKTISGILVLSLWLVISCNVMQDTEKPGNSTGSLIVKFDLSGSEGAKSIISDFSQVNSGKVFLQQGGSSKYQADLTINTAAKTGEATLSAVVIGSYDVIIELYDSASKVIYSGTGTVTINSDSTNTVTTPLAKAIGSLALAGGWSEDIPGLTSAIVELRKAAIVRYAGNLVVDSNNKTVTGGLNNIQPGAYELYVEIKNAAGMVCFTGTQALIINPKNNSITLTLVVKTGSIVINVTGDVTAPAILTGPAAAVNGQDVTITWTTDENATSNVCFSATSGFDYELATDWAPVGQDLTADSTNHSVTIYGLVQERTYYYVVVSADAEGNMIVSDEQTFTVTPPAAIPRGGLVGEWLFDGNADDTSGYGNNGTVHGVSPAADRLGNANRAYRYDGTDDYIVMGNDLAVNDEMTISIWLYPEFNTLSDSAYDQRWWVHSRSIMRKSNNSDDTFNIGLYGNPDYYNPAVPPTIEAGVVDTASNYPALRPGLPGLNIIQGSWCHLVLTYKRNNQLILYINGSNAGQTPTADHGIRASTVPLVFGVWAEQWNQCWQGLLDDARIYNRVLSAAEIQALYHEGGWAQ